VTRLSTDGFWICLASLPAAGAGLLFLWAVIRLRRSPGARDTLALMPAHWRAYLAWNALLALLLAAFTLLNHWLNRPVPEWMQQVFDTAGSPTLLVLAIVLMAPLFEEVLFRGFLFRSWLPSRLGASGTVFLTTLVWTAIHIQYAPYELAQVFAVGLLLGTARVRTGSLFVPLSMHALMNLAATVEMALTPP